jgi:hypothetical protein
VTLSRNFLFTSKRQQPKVEEAPVVIVACADLEGWRNGDLDEIIRLAQQHGYGDQARYASMRKNIANFLGNTPGAAGGLAPDFAVWANRQTMIAFTTMMWMCSATIPRPWKALTKTRSKRPLAFPLTSVSSHCLPLAAAKEKTSASLDASPSAHGICREVG